MYDNFISWSEFTKVHMFYYKEDKRNNCQHNINAFSVSAKTNLHISFELRSLSKLVMSCQTISIFLHIKGKIPILITNIKS